MAIGWDDLLSVPTMGIYSAQKAAGGLDVGEGTIGGADIGEAFKDYSNVGKNKFQPTPYQVNPQYWGGQEGMADWYSQQGQAGLAGSRAGQAWAQGQAEQTGPQAFENQALSNREATSRGYHQEGALNLALQGALGNQPSVAAYQLQSGLDQSLAQQAAMAGGARGAAGMATAQANQAAAGANLQQNAFTEAGRLRAQEIANYSQMYGGLSGQQREQDLARLGMGNQMSQFNVGAQNQRQLGFGQLANQYAQTGQGWYGASMQPYNQQYQGDLEQEGRRQSGYEASLGLGASIAQANAEERARMRDRFTGAAVQSGQTVVGAGLGQKGAPS